MSAAPVLQAQGLVRRYGGLVAVAGVDLAVQPGELHALIGPNGAGKTTLIQLLSGALAPSSGSVLLAGRDVTGLPMHRRARLGLVRSWQITSVFMRLSVRDNLVLALQGRAQARGFWRPARAQTHFRAAAGEVAKRVDLAARLDSLAGALSHGEQRQLEIGLVLAMQPRLMLLDEPMAGMGRDESARLLELLQGLRGHIPMLLVEHDMDSVFRLADRISTLVDGRVIASGTPEHIHAHPEVRRAYLGDETLPGVPA